MFYIFSEKINLFRVKIKFNLQKKITLHKENNWNIYNLAPLISISSKYFAYKF